ncbi:MAG: DUF1015 domain-containing protein [Oscillospiraceae bacterium]|nr:DUF1015 domain-containing protein [Oscillospiraceae bacterium]
MPREVFLPGDIMLPRNADMSKWSVIACDQFSSQPEYWQKAESTVGKSISTLRLMLPEAYLETRDPEEEIIKINANMKEYIGSGVFETLSDSYIYIERRLSGGKVRKGILGLLDLEQYDFKPGAPAAVRPTEATVEDRLPPRVKIRERAALEMPHIVIFINDPCQRVIEPLAEMKDTLPELYDFELMQGGGGITGRRVFGRDALSLRERLSEAEIALSLPGAAAPFLYAVGDGNHSLAAAKLYYESIKKSLGSDDGPHPARYCLAELVNLHDDSVEFEAIHRVMFNTDTAAFPEEVSKFTQDLKKAAGDGPEIRMISASGSVPICANWPSSGEMIAAIQKFCDDYVSKHGGKIDFIHGDAAALDMAKRPGCAAVILPKPEKSELYPSIAKSGVFPKKSFSIGHAEDKRYYLECRRINE